MAGRAGGSERTGLVVGVVVVALAVTAVGLTVLLELTQPAVWNGPDLVTRLYFAPVQLAFGLVGAAVVSRRPRHPVGWLFAAVGVALGVNGLAAPWPLLGVPGSDLVVTLARILSAAVLGLLALALLLFPDGRPVSRGWRWVVRLVVVQMAVAAAAAAVEPVPSWARPLETASSFIAGLLLLALAVASLVVRWRRANGDERQQVKWLALAGSLFAAEILLGLVTLVLDDQTTSDTGEYVGNAIFALTLLSIPVAMGLALTRYHLYDVERLLSRTLTFVVLASALSLVYVGVLAAVAGPVLGAADGGGLAWMAVAAVGAALLSSARSGLSDRVERWVYGERAGRYRTMRRLAEDLASVAAPDDVLARIAEAAGRSTRARSAWVELGAPGVPARRASWRGDGTGGSSDPREVAVPLDVDGQRVGQVVVVDPSGRPTDQRLLSDVVDLAAPAVHNLLVLRRLEALADTLARQNDELVASKELVARAADDERAAVRQVVVGQLQPAIEALRDGLPAPDVDTPEDLRTRYGVLAGYSRELAADVRRLAHAILPPLLVDRGLVPALRALAREAALDVTVDVDPSADAERLPPDVETAVFLACREALGSLEDAARLTVARRDGRFAFTLTGGSSGAVGYALPAALGRVSALGGRVEVRDAGARRTLTGAVPIPVD